MAKRKYVKENNLVKAINTDSLELQKPLVNEYYDINVHNSNMDKIDKGYKQNKNDISNINYELSKTENTKYSTENGIKEFSCKDGYVDNVVIEGKTLVNIGKTITKNVGNDAIRTRFEGNGDDYRSRYSNNTFTLINYTDKVISFPTMSKDNTSWSTQYDVQPNSRIAVQIPNDASLVGVDYWNINGWTLSNDTVINDSFFAILEGDHTDKPISYFEGLKSVGQGDKIEVLTRSESNKNLFYGGVESGYINSSTGEEGSSVNGVRSIEYIKVKPNTTYTVSNDKGYNVSVNSYNIYKSKYLGEVYGKTPFTFTTNNEAHWLRIRTFAGNKENDSTIKWQLEEGVSATEYVPPKYNKKQILTTLRSLPNGVKDTIEKRGNKYYKIKRCGEVVLNENLAWFKVGDIVQANTVQFGFKKGNDVAYKGDSEVFFNCDKIPPTEERNWQEDREFIFINPNDYVISISKTRLSTQDVAGFKTWLSSNPITVVYELATPIIEELPNFNPQTFSDKTTLLLNSGVIQAEASFEVTNSLGSELEVLKNKVSDLDNYVVDEEVYYPTLLNGFSQVHFNDNNFIKKIGNMCFMNLVFRNTSNVQDGTLICKLPLNFKSKNVTRVVSIGDILNANIDINENNILIYPSSKNISNVPFRVNCCWEVD